MDQPTDARTDEGSGLPRPRTPRTPFVNPDVPPNRWRCPSGVRLRLAGALTPGGATVAYDVVELHLLRDDPGGVRLTLVNPGFTLVPQPVWVSGVDFRAVRDRCTPLPRLLPAHDAVGCYAPITGSLFTGAAHPHDVIQGHLGSCRTASAFQALAATPNGPGHLRSLIREVDGGYVVRLRPVPRPGTRGRVLPPIDVFVDSFLPIEVATGKLLYCLCGPVLAGHPAPCALWPAILEQALATLWGGYGALEAGGIHEDLVFQALGCPYLAVGGNLAGKLNLLNTRGVETTATQVQEFVTAVARAGGAITLPGTTIQHNYAVVAVRPDGVVVADPRTGHSAEELARWAAPNRGTGVDQWILNDPAVWPIFFSWADLLVKFRWLYAYQVPVD